MRTLKIDGLHSNPLKQEMFPSHRHILNSYFAQSHGKQIISHQIESFNHFMDVDIPEIVTMVNPIVVRGSPEIPLSGPRSALASATGLSTTAANALMNPKSDDSAPQPVYVAPPVKREYEVSLEFRNPTLRKPTIFENNGAVLPMMPNDARMRNLTYASPLFVDVRVRTTFIDNTKQGERIVRERLFPNTLKSHKTPKILIQRRLPLIVVARSLNASISISKVIGLNCSAISKTCPF